MLIAIFNLRYTVYDDYAVNNMQISYTTDLFRHVALTNQCPNCNCFDMINNNEVIWAEILDDAIHDFTFINTHLFFLPQIFFFTEKKKKKIRKFSLGSFI